MDIFHFINELFTNVAGKIRSILFVWRNEKRSRNYQTIKYRLLFVYIYRQIRPLYVFMQLIFSFEYFFNVFLIPLNFLPHRINANARIQKDKRLCVTFRILCICITCNSVNPDASPMYTWHCQTILWNKCAARAVKPLKLVGDRHFECDFRKVRHVSINVIVFYFIRNGRILISSLKGMQWHSFFKVVAKRTHTHTPWIHLFLHAIRIWMGNSPIRRNYNHLSHNCTHFLPPR